MATETAPSGTQTTPAPAAAAAPETPATPTAGGTPEGSFLGDATQSGKPKTDEQTSKSEGTPKPPGEAAPPTTYDLKLPDGFKVEPDVLKEFTGLAGEAKLAPEAAQKLLDFSMKVEKQRIDAADKQWAKTQADWAAEIKNDKEIGGASFEASKAYATRVLKEVAPDLQQVLVDYGLSNHPVVARAFVKLGKELFAEGNTRGLRGATQTPSTNRKAFLDALYNNPSSPK